MVLISLSQGNELVEHSQDLMWSQSNVTKTRKLIWKTCSQLNLKIMNDLVKNGRDLTKKGTNLYNMDLMISQFNLNVRDELVKQL